MCTWCGGSGCAHCGYGSGWGGAATAKPAVKVGDLHAGRCKRCKNDSSLRVVKVALDKLDVFCKLCGTEAEVRR